jgi:small subunit ribosomal protein S25e
MGGVKKKSMASMEKKQESAEGSQTSEPMKGKKVKEQKAAPQQQKRLPFLVPKMTEEEKVKTLAPLKAITVYAASRAFGVNASIATDMLRDLEARKVLKRVGGFSGHFVWTVASVN